MEDFHSTTPHFQEQCVPSGGDDGDVGSKDMTRQLSHGGRCVRRSGTEIADGCISRTSGLFWNASFGCANAGVLRAHRASREDLLTICASSCASSLGVCGLRRLAVPTLLVRQAGWRDTSRVSSCVRLCVCVAGERLPEPGH